MRNLLINKTKTVHKVTRARRIAVGNVIHCLPLLCTAVLAVPMRVALSILTIPRVYACTICLKGKHFTGIKRNRGVLPASALTWSQIELILSGLIKNKRS